MKKSDEIILKKIYNETCYLLETTKDFSSFETYVANEYKTRNRHDAIEYRRTCPPFVKRIQSLHKPNPIQ